MVADVYFDGSLRGIPAKDSISEGSFLFQVKFVENANAAGARFDGILLDAVRKEMLIESKLAFSSPDGQDCSITRF